MKKNTLFASITIVASVAVCLGVFEVFLRTTDTLSELDSDTPIYIPAHLVRFDKIIDNRHQDIARNTKFRFNDVEPRQRKADGTFRLAVVGDSFIFGDGVPDNIRWSKMLEATLHAESDRIEVFHWGRNGWSTKQQLDFLKAHGKEFDVDAYVFGWVTNDPFLGDTPWESPETHAVFYYAGLSFIFPEATKWISDYLDQLILARSGSSYGRWEETLYEPENLGRYANVLKDLRDLLDAWNTPYLFVLTPTNGSVRYDKLYAKMLPVFDELAIPYLNLLPEIKSKLGTQARRASWANPADPHPGEPVTRIYAREVAQVLRRSCGRLANRPGKCNFATVTATMTAANR